MAMIIGAATMSTAAAQTPQEIVRWVYASLLNDGHASQKGIDFLSSPAQRGSYFSDRMEAFYSSRDNGAMGCIDFGFAIPGNDFDAGEVVQSLQISTRENANGGLTVQANFTNFGEAAHVEYDFAAEDGYWKIDDIAGAHFRVSQIDCSAQKNTAPVSSAAYCYKQGDDTLRLDVSATGDAHLDFVSWQANYHTCSADMAGRQVADGWDFHDAQGCVIQVRVSGGNINLADPDWACKPMMCGQRAVIDGISFPAATQIDCAAWTELRR